jgi:carbon-monoxide dehydrogenase large subunit
VKILRYVVVNDSGRAINPMIVEGQVVGGTAHGIGNALFEHMGYDAGAQPVTTTFADYLLAGATEVPRIEVSLAEYPSPLNPLGVKGVGEAGCVPAAAAIVAAVEHALAPFGARIESYPVTPAMVVAMIGAACGALSKGAIGAK